MAVTIANMIGIRLLPLPKWSHFWNVLSSSGRHHISPTGLTFAKGSHFFLNWTCNSFHKLSVKWWSLLLLDNFLGIGVSPSHHPFYSCSSFQSPENTRDNQQNLKKKKNSRPDLHQLFSCQTSDWCNSVRKSKLQFSGHVYLQTERWRSYTNTIPKTCYNSSKTAGFPLHLFENSSLEVSENRRSCSKTSTGVRPDLGGGTPHMKGVVMLVVSLRGAISDFGLT